MLATDSLIEGLSKVQYQLNNKEGLITAGTTAQYWRGDKTWQTLNTSVVPEGTNLYYTDARSRSAISSSATGLTYTSGTGVFSLTAGYAIPTTSALGNYDTAYNRSLTAVAVSGTTTKTITLTKQDGTTLTASWSDYDTAPVTSVFGRTGAIVATSGDYTTAQVTESGNLYYTDARARASLSFTAGSGAYNSTTGVITIPTNTSQLTNGANFITLASLSASSPLSYNSGTGAFSISQATTSTNGYLSSTDWNTFNNKQNALGYTPVPTTRTLTINGTAYDLSADRSWTVAGTISGLTTNYIPKATSATTIGNSLIYDNGSNIGIGTTSPIGNVGSTALQIVGTDYPVFTITSSNQTINGRLGVGYQNAYIGTTTNHKFIIITNDTARATFDTSGNFGLGVTPSASNLPTFESQYGLFVGQSQTNIVANGYYSSGYIYKNTDLASRYQQISGQHVWYNAPSGTAGSAISFTQAMTLDASGNLAIGTTSAVNSKLYVSNSGVANLIIGYNNTSVNYYDANTHYFRNASAS
jgi:hypothetical protein